MSPPPSAPLLPGDPCNWEGRGSPSPPASLTAQARAALHAAEVIVVLFPPSSFKQQNLEQRQADVEYELRCLLNKPGECSLVPSGHHPDLGTLQPAQSFPSRLGSGQTAP